MYPETDIPTQRIDDSKWQSIIDNLPMTDSQRLERMNQYDISEDQKEQILARELDDSFVNFGDNLPAKAWATVLLENDTTAPELSSRVLIAKEQGAITREAINDVINHFVGSLPELEQIIDYAEQHGLKPVDASDIAAVISSIVEERLDFVRDRGMGAIGPLMGVVMQQVGAADGKVVSALLKEAILEATK